MTEYLLCLLIMTVAFGFDHALVKNQFEPTKSGVVAMTILTFAALYGTALYVVLRVVQWLGPLVWDRAIAPV